MNISVVCDLFFDFKCKLSTFYSTCRSTAKGITFTFCKNKTIFLYCSFIYLSSYRCMFDLRCLFIFQLHPYPIHTIELKIHLDIRKIPEILINSESKATTAVYSPLQLILIFRNEKINKHLVFTYKYVHLHHANCIRCCLCNFLPIFCIFETQGLLYTGYRGTAGDKREEVKIKH